MASIGNLGDYQRFTMTAKKVGGPKILLGIVSGASALAGAAITKGVSSAKHRHKQTKSLKEKTEATYYTVETSAADNQGLLLNKGDKFRVLDRNGDIILIDITNRNDNPFYVSAEFLHKVSNFGE